MRVIGGTARGRRLSAPRLAGLRPTSDRVREAIFDILEARALVEGSSFLDLFAGSGALGIEALSRGASACTFVDSDRRALLAVEANLAATGLAGREGVRVVHEEVLQFARRGAARADVALVDPPYGFADWAALLGLLEVEVAVLEHASSLGDLPPGVNVIRSYRYGGTLVTLAALPSRHEDRS